MAMAPPLTFTFSMSGWCSFSHASTTEANASLISIEVDLVEVMPGPCSTFSVAGIGAVSMSRGSSPASANCTNRARGGGRAGGLLLAHDEQGGRAVGDLRAVAGRHLAVLLERRLEAGQLLERGLADALVGRSSACPRRRAPGRISRSKRPSSGPGRRTAASAARRRPAPRGTGPTCRRSSRPRCPAAPGRRPTRSGRRPSGPNGKPYLPSTIEAPIGTRVMTSTPAATTTS